MSSIDPRPLSFGRGSVATKNRLTLLDSLTFDEWCAVGERITGLTEASAWWLGDWLFFGQWQYGNKYVAAVEITGLDEQTLRVYSSVAGRFDLLRRRNELSFSHHREAVALPPDQADVILDRAAKGGWNRVRLREEIRALKAPLPTPAALGPPDAPIPTESIVEASNRQVPDVVTLDVSAKRGRSWAAAAAASGKSVRDWAIATLDTAAAAAAA